MKIIAKEKYHSIAIPREQCYKISGWCNKNAISSQKLFNDAYSAFIVEKKELPDIPTGSENSTRKLFKMTSVQKKAIEEFGNKNGWSISRTVTRLILGYIVSLGNKYEGI